MPWIDDRVNFGQPELNSIRTRPVIETPVITPLPAFLVPRQLFHGSSDLVSDCMYIQFLVLQSDSETSGKEALKPTHG